MGLDEKHILKKAFRRILPKDICSRPKHPYRAPIKQSLLNERTAGDVEDVLSDTAIKNGGLFDIPKVKMLLKKSQAVGNPSEVDSMALAGILSSQLVVEQFVEKFGTYATNRSNELTNMTVHAGKASNSDPQACV